MSGPIDDDPIVCDECSLVYSVVWNNDGGAPPIEFCPRCGSDSLNLPDIDDE